MRNATRHFTVEQDAHPDSFRDTLHHLTWYLLDQEPSNTGTWQSLDVSGSELHKTHELLNVTHQLIFPGGTHEGELAAKLFADLPWAEDHFQERVGGQPINPGVEWENWPYHSGQKNLHRRNTAGEPDKFDHNYMERFWPKQANQSNELGRIRTPRHRGIRFPYGDLADVVTQLRESTGTRQAYLPVFFPEDTGATEGQRVPCSLGYHFMMREGVLFTQYNLRSCDIFRHFRNDVYMAARLSQWVAEKAGLSPNAFCLTTNISNLHLFVGDVHRQEALMDQVMADQPLRAVS